MPVLPRGADTVRGRASGPATTGMLNGLDRIRPARTALRIPTSPGTPVAFEGLRFDTYTGEPGDGSAGWDYGTWTGTTHATPSGTYAPVLDPRAQNIYFVTTTVEIAGGPPNTPVIIQGQRNLTSPVQIGGGIRTVTLDASGYGIDSVEWWGLLGPGQGLAAGASPANAITGMTANIAVGGYTVVQP